VFAACGGPWPSRKIICGNRQRLPASRTSGRRLVTSVPWDSRPTEIPSDDAVSNARCRASPPRNQSAGVSPVVSRTASNPPVSNSAAGRPRTEPNVRSRTTADGLFGRGPRDSVGIPVSARSRSPVHRWNSATSAGSARCTPSASCRTSSTAARCSPVAGSSQPPSAAAASCRWMNCSSGTRSSVNGTRLVCRCGMAANNGRSRSLMGAGPPMRTRAACVRSVADGSNWTAALRPAAPMASRRFSNAAPRDRNASRPLGSSVDGIRSGTANKSIASRSARNRHGWQFRIDGARAAESTTASISASESAVSAPWSFISYSIV